MEPTQTTRKVAVNKIEYVPTEVTVLKPVQVVRQMQTGTPRLLRSFGVDGDWKCASA